MVVLHGMAEVKCRWFLGLASTSVAEDARRIVNGSRARVLEALPGPSPLEVLLHAYQLRGAFPGGPPLLACSLTDTSILLVLENLLPQLQQVRQDLPFSAICGSRLLLGLMLLEVAHLDITHLQSTETAAASVALAQLPLSFSLMTLQARALRLPLCVQRPEEVCALGGPGPRYPTALHVRGAAGHHSQSPGAVFAFGHFMAIWPWTSDIVSWDHFGQCHPNGDIGDIQIGWILPLQHVATCYLPKENLSELPFSLDRYLDLQHRELSGVCDLVKNVKIGHRQIAKACAEAVDVLVGQYIAAKLKVATPNETLDEQKFQRIEQERLQGWKYDLVLKLRTDVEIAHPLSLADFPEVATARVIYSAGDIVFFCNREVAHILFDDILQKLTSRAGNERKLLPLNYGRILRTGEGNALPLQVFPDVGKELRDALVGNQGRGFLISAIRKHRASLEAAHLRAESEDVPIFSGHWRFRNDTKQYQYWKKTNRIPRDHEMCSMRHWFYHVHQAEPEVLMRGWSGSPLKLSRTRHYQHCNCEPPTCIPDGWPVGAMIEREYQVKALLMPQEAVGLGIFAGSWSKMVTMVTMVTVELPMREKVMLQLQHGGAMWGFGFQRCLIICIILLVAAVLAALYVRRKRQMAAHEVEQPLSEA
eukprot:s1026_g16.t1